MITRGGALVGLSTVVAAPLAAAAQSAAPDASAAPPDAQLRPLGIALERHPYPYPRRMLPLTVQNVDVRMAYLDLAPAGPPAGVALLLHGRNFPAGYWKPVIDAFVGRGWRVIAPDQLGFNASSHAELRYDFPLWADTTAQLLDALGVPHVDLLVGHSIGGIMATTLAARHPSRVRRLLLEDPLGLEDYRVLIPAVTDAFLYEHELHMTADGYRAFLASNYFPHWSEEYEWLVTIRREIALSADYPQWVRVYIQSYQQLHRTPIADTLRELTMPVHLIVGEFDHNAPGKAYAPEAVRGRLGHNAELARALVPTLHAGGLDVLPGVGHCPHLDAFDRFDAIARTFATA
ncbi:MAG TPA: alpha/beta hydrolase [Candidatus Sulfotelmatobacter sp.]|nr:alpha/beta hydrolase [Candidatus Sulfotelmatobacter sp.]